MKKIEYQGVVDKASWGRGPWDAEPDKVQWQDRVTKLPCLAVRQPSGGHWCGYVGVSKGHPSYGCMDEDLADVHGGITYGNHCMPGSDEDSVCHIPDEGETDDVWWLGFDCAHSFDLSPGWPYGRDINTYRTLSYVKEQCGKLAGQIKEAATHD